MSQVILIKRDEKGRFVKGNQSRLGTIQSEHVRKSVAMANRKRIFKEETRQKHRKNAIERHSEKKLGYYGKPAWNKGLRRTQEQKDNISKVRAKTKIPFKDSKPEKIFQLALNLNGILFSKHRQDLIGYPDIFIEPNICVFIDGDYFHGNPKFYKLESILMKGKRAIDKWKYDHKKTKMLLNEGYKVIRFWEFDIKKDVQISIDTVKRVMKL